MQLDSFNRCINHKVLHIKALKESSFMSITQLRQKKIQRIYFLSLWADFCTAATQKKTAAASLLSSVMFICNPTARWTQISGWRAPSHSCRSPPQTWRRRKSSKWKMKKWVDIKENNLLILNNVSQGRHYVTQRRWCEMMTHMCLLHKPCLHPPLVSLFSCRGVTSAPSAAEEDAADASEDAAADARPGPVTISSRCICCNDTKRMKKSKHIAQT